MILWPVPTYVCIDSQHGLCIIAPLIVLTKSGRDSLSFNLWRNWGGSSQCNLQNNTFGHKSCKSHLHPFSPSCSWNGNQYQIYSDLKLGCALCSSVFQTGVKNYFFLFHLKEEQHKNLYWNTHSHISWNEYTKNISLHGLLTYKIHDAFQCTQHYSML